MKPLTAFALGAATAIVAVLAALTAGATFYGHVADACYKRRHDRDYGSDDS